MLRSMRIRNFKIWKDTGMFRMAPITLLFGSNSSGKSSIGQLLMMLKQTVEYPDRKAVLYPGGKNSAVQLGSYQEMVFNRYPKHNISFGYHWDLPRALKVEDPITTKKYSGSHLGFAAVLGLEDEKQNSVVIKQMGYILGNLEEVTLRVGLKQKDSEPNKYEATASEYALIRKKMRAWSLKDAVRFYGFPDELFSYYQNANFVQDLTLSHEKLFRSMYYLGPLRTKADRLYSWGGAQPESVGFSGENTIAAILAARDRELSLGYKKRKRPFESIVAMKLKEMGLIENFKIRPISKHRQEYEVKVRVKGSRRYVDLPDVGFGVSQVLPVLVQCFYAPPGSIILMEQPEIHLHPKAQSILADVMIDVINSREDGADRNIQLIIETHSEHFLRRLQRRIAEDYVPQEKVAAYFSNVDQSPAKLVPLEIDEYGNIKNWPEDFFGDEMGDITAQTEAAMNKRMCLKSRELEEDE